LSSFSGTTHIGLYIFLKNTAKTNQAFLTSVKPTLVAHQ